LLAEALAQFLRDDPHRTVDGAAGGKRNDDLDRPRWIILCVGLSGREYGMSRARQRQTRCGGCGDDHATGRHQPLRGAGLRRGGKIDDVIIRDRSAQLLEFQ
jgi:hypothetical protein